jgi:hypothetical protein
MSRSAHDHSTRVLRQLPKCPKCKGQFVLVCVQYADSLKVVYEWECFRCMKTFPREAFNEEPLSQEDITLKEFLHGQKKNSTKRR